MKMKMKALAAAVALAAAGNANAAIDTGNNSNGEMFVSVWDQTNAISYTRDLGITYNDFLANINNSATTYNFAADALYTSTFGAVDPSTLVWNIAAVNNFDAGFTNYTTYGVMSSSNNAAGVMSTTEGAMPGLINNGNYFAAGVNANTAAPFDFASNVSATATGGDGYFGSNLWGNNWGGLAGFNDTAAVGQSLDFYAIIADQTPYLNGGSAANMVYIQAANQWTLAADGTLNYAASTPSAVPVPAAVWLLGSAMVGLVGVARRRNEA